MVKKNEISALFLFIQRFAIKSMGLVFPKLLKYYKMLMLMLLKCYKMLIISYLMCSIALRFYDFFILFYIMYYLKQASTGKNLNKSWMVCANQIIMFSLFLKENLISFLDKSVLEQVFVLNCVQKPKYHYNYLCSLKLFQSWISVY